VKREALVALGEIAAAIPVARNLVTVENTAVRWNELLELCERVEDWPAMTGFAEEALRLHPKAPELVAARDRARARLPADAVVPPPVEEAPDRPSWFRRAINKITGKQTPVTTATADSFDHKLNMFVDELVRYADVTDRPRLLQVLRVAHAGADEVKGQVIAMRDACRESGAVRNLPPDSVLVSLLRRALS
jgi:hypothetical protein